MNQPLSDKELLSILSFSSGARAIYISEKLVIQTINQSMLDLWSRDNSILGQQLMDVIPELRDYFFEDESLYGCLKNVWNSGVPYQIRHYEKTRLVESQPGHGSVFAFNLPLN